MRERSLSSARIPGLLPCLNDRSSFLTEGDLIREGTYVNRWRVCSQRDSAFDSLGAEDWRVSAVKSAGQIVSESASKTDPLRNLQL